MASALRLRIILAACCSAAARSACAPPGPPPLDGSRGGSGPVLLQTNRALERAAAAGSLSDHHGPVEAIVDTENMVPGASDMRPQLIPLEQLPDVANDDGKVNMAVPAAGAPASPPSGALGDFEDEPPLGVGPAAPVERGASVPELPPVWISPDASELPLVPRSAGENGGSPRVPRPVEARDTSVEGVITVPEHAENPGAEAMPGPGVPLPPSLVIPNDDLIAPMSRTESGVVPEQDVPDTSSVDDMPPGNEPLAPRPRVDRVERGVVPETPAAVSPQTPEPPLVPRAANEDDAPVVVGPPVQSLSDDAHQNAPEAPIVMGPAAQPPSEHAHENAPEAPIVMDPAAQPVSEDAHQSSPETPMSMGPAAQPPSEDADESAPEAPLVMGPAVQPVSEDAHRNIPEAPLVMGPAAQPPSMDAHEDAPRAGLVMDLPPIEEAHVNAPEIRLVMPVPVQPPVEEAHVNAPEIPLVMPVPMQPPVEEAHVNAPEIPLVMPLPVQAPVEEAHVNAPEIPLVMGPAAQPPSM